MDHTSLSYVHYDLKGTCSNFFSVRKIDLILIYHLIWELNTKDDVISKEVVVKPFVNIIVRGGLLHLLIFYWIMLMSIFPL